VNSFDSATGQAVSGEVRDKLLEPLIAATCAGLGEMADAEVVVRAGFQPTTHHALGDIAAVVGLRSREGFLVLSFPERTATALSRAILAGVTEEVDESLIRDCVGEIANVIAGQAKALLAGSPYPLTFSMPQVVDDARVEPGHGLDCLVVHFGSNHGEFSLQVCLKL
jgi:chemotaxis protein CheX